MMSLAMDPTNRRRHAEGGSERPGWLQLAAAFATVALVYRFSDGRRRSGAASRTGEPGRVVKEGGNHAPISEMGDGTRGRQAAGPSDIPKKGWKDVFWRVWEEMNNDRVLAVGAGVTFYAILAIFPFIAAFVSLYGLIADPTVVQTHLETLSGILPTSAVDIVGDQMNRLAENDKQSLGFGFIASLAIALWSSNAGVKALFDALNVAYDETEKRSFIKLTAISMMVTIGAIVFIMLAIAALVALPIALGYIGLGGTTEALFSLGRWPALFLLVAFGIAVLYRYGPSRERAKWRWITWGAAFASIAFILVSLAFSFYTSNFADYNATYGSLGAVIAFMTWIWISSLVILVGAELNSELEHQTAQDSTTGAPKPIGSRGAVMADTIGQKKT